MYNTVTEIEKSIKEQEIAIAELYDMKRNAIKNRKANLPSANLAVILHELKCRYNHTDGCAWYYEMIHGVADWSQPEHNTYYELAKRMLNDNNFDQIVSVLKGVYPEHLVWKQ